MPEPMPERVDQVVNAARRRLAWQQLEASLAGPLRVALLAAVILIGADRLWRLRFEPWTAAGGLVGLAAAVGLILGLRRRPGLIDTAVELDRRLGLKERLSSALALEDRQAGELLDPLLRDAESHAREIDVRRALPWAPSPGIRLCLVLALLAGGLSLLPSFTFWRSESDLATEMVTRQVGEELVELARRTESRADETGDERARQAARRLMREALALRRARMSKEQALLRLERAGRELRAAREQSLGHPLRRTAETARRDLRQVEGRLGEVGRQLEDERPDAAAEMLRELARQTREGKLGADQAGELADQARQAAEALRDSPHHRQAEALKRAAEALEQAGEAAGSDRRQSLSEAAEAFEDAAESLADGAVDGTDDQLLRDLQEAAEAGKDAVGQAEELKRQAEAGGGQSPDGLTEPGGQSGEGSSQSPGGSPGQPGGGGQDGPSDDGAGGPDLDGGRGVDEELYAPRRTETLQRDERARARPNAAGGYATTQGPRGSLGLPDSRVPYEQVLGEYRAEADEAMAETDIPLTQRQRVKRYFDQLRDPRGAEGP